MKKLTVTCLTTIVMAFSPFAMAQKKSKSSSASSWSSSTYSGYSGNYIHEVDLNLSLGEIHNYKQGKKNHTDLSALGSYNRLLQDNIQVGAYAGFTTLSDAAGDHKMYVTLMGTGTYNLDNDLDDSIFATGGIGIAPAYDKDDLEYKSSLSFFVGGGKRFQLYEHVHYKPEVRFEKRGDEDMAIRIVLLNVSLMF